MEESKPTIPEDETKPTGLPPFSKSDSQDKKKRSHYSSLTSPIEPEKGNIEKEKEKAVRQQEKENLTPVEPVKQVCPEYTSIFNAYLSVYRNQ